MKKLLGWAVALCAVGLWVYFAFFKQSPLETKRWEDASCYMQGRKDYVAANNCRFELSVATMMALPHLAYGDRLSCRLAKPGEKSTLPPPEGYACPASNTPKWGKPERGWDIGWDSYLLWSARPAAIFFLSQRPDWPGLGKALNDLKFLQMFPDDEDIHYPWAITLLYYGLMKAQGSPNPLILQIACVLAAFACMWLYRRAWPGAPTWLWLLFAFVPVGGRFLVHVMGDVWMVLLNLLLLRSLQTRKAWLGILSAVLLVHAKQEGFIHVFALCGAFFFYERQLPWRPLLACVLALGAHKWWASQWPINMSLYTPLTERFTDVATYTRRFPEMAKYYADVLTRFKHWVVLWPLAIYALARSWRRLHWAWVPLLCFVLVIPIGYVQFPDGTYREIILTGAPRSLWPILPLLWWLLSKSEFFGGAQRRRKPQYASLGKLRKIKRTRA